MKTAWGQSRSPEKAWSRQPRAVKLWLFSGFPRVIFMPGKERGQLQTCSQIADTKKKTSCFDIKQKWALKRVSEQEWCVSHTAAL